MTLLLFWTSDLYIVTTFCYIKEVYVLSFEPPESYIALVSGSFTKTAGLYLFTMVLMLNGSSEDNASRVKWELLLVPTNALNRSNYQLYTTLAQRIISDHLT